MKLTTLTILGTSILAIGLPNLAQAQSAGTSLTGTSNGKDGGPQGSGATGDTFLGVGSSGGSATTSTGGSHAGQQPTATSEQHEKLGN